MSPEVHLQVTRLGLTLLHFLWQGLALAALLGVLLWMLQGHSPRLRYGIACLVLLLMALTPTATWLLLRSQATSQASGAPFVLTRVSSTLAEPRMVDPRPWGAAIPMAVACWTLGVGILSLRLVGHWLWIQGLRRRRTTQPAPDPLQDLLQAVSQRLGLRRPLQLLICAQVTGPTVLGWLRPVILIPPAALSGLSPDQLEWILAHEVAHILRHDFAINLLQSCVEVLLFYHPAVWWVSSQIRQERELCCDDLAVKTSGDALNYAAALTRLEALSLQAALPPPAARRLALAATGGSFMHRIQRLISPSSPTPLAPRAGLALLLLLGTGAALQARNRLLSSGTTQQAPQPAPRPLSMNLRQVDLPTVIRVLADQAGVNLVLSPDVQGKVDCQFTETPWDQILDAKLAPLGYAWELRNGVLHVAPASRLRDRVRLTEALVTARSAKATYSGRPISIDLRRVPLADLLRQVAAHGGVTVEVEPGVRGTFSFKFEDTPWDQVLDLILLTANLEWEFRGGVLHVRNRPEMPR